MTLMEQTFWGIMNATPVTTEAANDGIIITVLFIAFLLIVLKPDFSRF